mmetsp:Transcript_16391/g.25336  ORF Transcript_16391/g.25336 Transcript_16391/m.25336 type:complete len:88 (+) Transcript_16391:619-882(+)
MSLTVDKHQQQAANSKQAPEPVFKTNKAAPTSKTLVIDKDLSHPDSFNPFESRRRETTQANSFAYADPYRDILVECQSTFSRSFVEA